MIAEDPRLAPWMPRLIETWRRAKGRAGVGPMSSEEHRELVAGITTLSAGLTRERSLVGARYLDDPRLLGAYLLFYWPVSYVQGRILLGELGSSPGRVLDLGSGPGPLALAALDAGALSVLAADRSPAALQVAAQLARGAARPLATAAWDPERGQALPDGPFDLVCFGHVLNELFGGDLERRVALVEAARARLAPGGAVLIVEPALKDTSRALLQLRDRLIARGVAVRAPCLFRGACPALERPSDWCHAEHPLDFPAPLDELARSARIHRDAVKMSYLILEGPAVPWPPPPPGRSFRIVSEPLPQKGQLRYVGCGPEGRAPLVLPTRRLAEGNRGFEALRRGEVIRVEGGLTPRGDGLRLDESTKVERVAAAGAPVRALAGAAGEGGLVGAADSR